MSQLQSTIHTLLLLMLSVVYLIRTLILTLIPTRMRAKDIRGDIVLVTGGGSGIGRLMCQRFSALGAHIITWDVNTLNNEETARLVRKAGGKCWAHTVDLCSNKAIYQAARIVHEEIGKVDILINNAGIVTGTPFLQAPDDKIQRTMAVNVMAHFWTVKAFLGEMIRTNKGHVVTIASLGGHSGVTKLVDYCSSKFAAVGFDESLRMELFANGNTGVHTTCVCPYYINTGMFEGVQCKMIPILEPDYVVEKIVEATLTNTAVLMLPGHLRVLILLKYILPSDLLLRIAAASGVSTSMDEFVGRRKNN